MDNATPQVSEPSPPETPPRGAPGPDDQARPSRYDANVRLINRRLADEKRSARHRRWWKGLSGA